MLGLVVLGAAAFVACLPWLAERALVAALEARGLERVDLRIERLGLAGARVADVRLGRGPALAVGAISADYRPLQLVRGRIAGLRVEAPELVVRLSQGALSLGELDVLRGAGAGDASGGGLPVAIDRVVVDAARVRVLTDRGVFQVAARGSGSLPGAGLPELAIRAEVAEEGGALQGSLELALVAGGALRGTAALRDPEAVLLELLLPPEDPLAGAAPLVLDLGLEGAVDGAERLRLDALRLGLQPLAWAGGRLDALALSLAGDGTREAFRGVLQLDARLDGQLRPELSLRQARLALGGDLEIAGRSLSLSLDDCLLLEAASAELPGGVRLRSPRLCLTGAEQALGADLTDPAAWSARLDLALAATALDLSLASGAAEPLRVHGTAPEVRVTGRFSPGRVALELEPSGGRLEVPGGVELETFSGRGELALAGEGPAYRAALRARRVRAKSAEGWLSPLQLGVDLDGGSEALEFSVRLSRPGGGLSLAARGEHRLADATGRAEVTLAPVVFVEGGLQPVDLAPRLRDQVESVSGAVAADARLAWSEAGLVSSGGLELRDLSLVSSYAAVFGAAGRIELDSLWPPSTPPGQEITFERLETGLPLTEGRIEFSVGADRRLSVARAEGGLAGGRLRAEGVLDFDRAEQDLRFRVRRVALASLVALAAVPDLEVSGVLGGEIPLEASGSRVRIRRARLAATPIGGSIRYRPEVPPPALASAGEAGDLVLRALRDFRYETLRLGLDGDVEEGVEAVLELRGSNPAVENGRPIELTVNLSGAVGEILRGMLLPSRVADRVRDRVLERGR